MAKEGTFLMLMLCAVFLHGTTGTPFSIADCLKEHNKIRAQHGAPPLQWDATLAADATKWANTLRQKGMTLSSTHDPTSRAGENVAMFSIPTCKKAVDFWYEEHYDYEDLGYCTNPPKVPLSYVLHFTQLVWKSTSKVGVGISGIWLVARYMPPGNAYRQYGKNVQCSK